jgi:hypothetical protein
MAAYPAVLALGCGMSMHPRERELREAWAWACLGQLAGIETAITQHTERRAGFTSWFDTPKQTKNKNQGHMACFRDKKK